MRTPESSNKEYQDIINHRYGNHSLSRRMPIPHRAAQFASFAALSGYEDRIAETARVTSEMINLSQEAKEEMSRLLAYIFEHRKEARIIYFQPDLHKEGGEYKLAKGKIRRIEEAEGIIIMEDHLQITLQYIVNIR